MARQIEQIPLARIRCAPQVREAFDQTSIEGLARSMAEVGQQQPIIVQPAGENFVPIDGERRVRAARDVLGWTHIDAIVEDLDGSGQSALQRQLISNLQRDDLRPCERARGVNRLMKESGWDATTVAAKLGLSEPTVSRALALLVLPKKAQDLIDGDKLSASVGYAIAKLRDGKERARLIALAKEGRLTRATLARLQQGETKPRRKRRTPMAKPESFLIGLGNGRSVMVIGETLNVSSIIEAVRDANARLAALPSGELSLEDAVKLLARDPRDEQKDAA